MATHNGKKFIERQLESILTQKNVDLKILISDDCSTDNTLNLIDKHVVNKKITLIKNKKKFGSAALNFFNLIEHAPIDDFDYISFSDQDDIWLEDKLSSAVSKLEELEYDGYSSDVMAFWDNDNNRKLIKKSYPQKEHDHWFESPGPGCSQVVSTKSFKLFQEFLRENKKHLGNIHCHDWLIYAFYRHNNLRWVISNEPKILYRQHANNVIGANYDIKSKLARLTMIMNDWYKKQIIYIYEFIVYACCGRFNPFKKMNKWIIQKDISYRIWETRNR